jgi:hypothetical protein
VWGLLKKWSIVPRLCVVALLQQNSIAVQAFFPPEDDTEFAVDDDMPWRLQRSPWERNQTLNWDGMNSSIPSPSLLDWEDLFPRAGTQARADGFVCLFVSGVPLNYSFSLFFSDPLSSLFVFLECGPHSLVDSPVGCGKVAFQVQKREKERGVLFTVLGLHANWFSLMHFLPSTTSSSREVRERHERDTERRQEKRVVHSSFLGFVGIFGRGSEEEEMEQVLLLSCVTDSSEHVNLCDHIILLHFGMTLSLSQSMVLCWRPSAGRKGSSATY